MKVLLTGATGFVGSHILDALQARSMPTAILLRSTSSKRLITSHLEWAEQRRGSIEDPPSLKTALEGITHIIHCAGCTKAASAQEFDAVNATGTANLLKAARNTGIQRFIHISSLAAVGPATADKPRRESDSPSPVSAYGKSKLAGENAVRSLCRAEFVIIRPPAVYGPRDSEFLRLFKAIQGHVLPRPSRQQLSLVYVSDLAAAIVACLENPRAKGKTYYVANSEVVCATDIANEIARQLGSWTIPLPLPAAFMWSLCLAYECKTRLTGKGSVLGLQKFAELRAPGWVCDSTQIEQDLGFRCQTNLRGGIGKTIEWYRSNRWL